MRALPIEDPAMDGSNWYGYCSNNPLKYVDPTGLSDTPADISQFFCKKEEMKSYREGVDKDYTEFMRDDPKHFSIKGAIARIAGSDWAKTKRGSGVTKRLRQMSREGKIAFNDSFMDNLLLPKDAAGVYIPGLDRIVINKESFILSLIDGIGTVGHEGNHAWDFKDIKNFFDRRLGLWTEHKAYTEESKIKSEIGKKRFEVPELIKDVVKHPSGLYRHYQKKNGEIREWAWPKLNQYDFQFGERKP